MIGIVGGLMFAGLVLGALSGSIVLLLIFTAAGLAVSAAAAAAKLQKEKAAARKLVQYPPYGY